MVAVLVMLAVRGASDWSHSFEAVWYGSLIVADMLGVVGVVSSLLPGRPPEPEGSDVENSHRCAARRRTMNATTTRT